MMRTADAAALESLHVVPGRAAIGADINIAYFIQTERVPQKVHVEFNLDIGQACDVQDRRKLICIFFSAGIQAVAICDCKSSVSASEIPAGARIVKYPFHVVVLTIGNNAPTSRQRATFEFLKQAA